jgi:hypothetical protein
MPSAKAYTRSLFDKSFDLLMKYERIVVRRADQDTSAFDELVAICDTEEKYSLLDELLSRFYYMDDEDYQNRVGQIAKVSGDRFLTQVGGTSRLLQIS